MGCEARMNDSLQPVFLEVHPQHGGLFLLLEGCRYLGDGGLFETGDGSGHAAELKKLAPVVALLLQRFPNGFAHAFLTCRFGELVGLNDGPTQSSLPNDESDVTCDSRRPAVSRITVRCLLSSSLFQERYDPGHSNGRRHEQTSDSRAKIADQGLIGYERQVEESNAGA